MVDKRSSKSDRDVSQGPLLSELDALRRRYAELGRTAVETKKTEAPPTEGEEKYRQLFATVSDAIIVFDADTRRFLDVNEGALRLYGYSREEFLSLRHGDITAEPAASEASIRETLTGIRLGVPLRYHRKKDGTVFPAEVAAGAFVWGGRSVVCGVIRDITDRKRVEAALWQSQITLNRAQRVAHIGSWHLDVIRGELTWSDESHRIFGVHPGTPVTHERFLETVHPDDRECVTTAWTGALTGQPYTIEYRILVAGEMKWVRENAEVEFDEDGTALRGIGTVQDITHRKQAEDALRARTRQLEALRVVSAEITRELDLPSLLDLIMHRSTELVGGSSGTIYLWVEAEQILTPQVWASHGAWMRDGRVRLGEGIAGLVAQRREGLIVNDYREWPLARPFILERTNITAVVAEPLLYRDRLLGVIAVDDQGTNRRFTEQDHELLRLFATQAAVAIENARLYEQVRDYAHELQRKVEERTRELQTANTQLRAANTELEAFSYSVSHDLRNPLLSIEGFGRLLLKKYGMLLEAEGTDYLLRVLAGAKRMGELIEALLGLARITRHPLREESVDLSTLARSCVNELRQRDRQREVEVAIPDGLVVQGDARLLHTLLENLLGNAWKFTANRRPARIEVGRLSGVEGEAVCFVRDDGVGFDMAEADKLFGMFQRLDGAEQFPGTGIGLATVRRIVERHGGRVWAEAAIGRGAAFFFTLGHAGAEPGNQAAC